MRFADSAGDNWFDPALGQVPTHASALQPLARVSDLDDTHVEFAYLDSANGILVDLDDGTLSVTQFPVDGPTLPGAWQIALRVVSPSASGERIVGFSMLDNAFADTLRVVLEGNVMRFEFDGNMILEVPGASMSLVLHTGFVALAAPSSLPMAALVCALAGGLGWRRPGTDRCIRAAACRRQHRRIPHSRRTLLRPPRR